jgi:chondroitin 4-sulfotransferase 11
MRLRKLARVLGVKSQNDRYIEELKTKGTFCFIHINKCGGTSVENALGLPLIHDTAQHRIDKISRVRWDALTSFALIRHPYDKVISHYKYRVKTNQTDMGDGHIELSDWVQSAYGDQERRYYDSPLMFQPCLHWLVDNSGEIVVNHIIKLEEIDSSWPALCKTVFGRPISLGQHNTTPKGAQAVRTEQLTPAAIAVLDKHFASDFERFGYAKSDRSI